VGQFLVRADYINRCQDDYFEVRKDCSDRFYLEEKGGRICHHEKRNEEHATRVSTAGGVRKTVPRVARRLLGEKAERKTIRKMSRRGEERKGKKEQRKSSTSLQGAFSHLVEKKSIPSKKGRKDPRRGASNKSKRELYRCVLASSIETLPRIAKKHKVKQRKKRKKKRTASGCGKLTCIQGGEARKLSRGRS